VKERIRAAARQPGQVLIIFGLMLPAMLGMIGLGIDVAHLYQERRQLQNTADLAALGGASQLPDNPGAAQSIAQIIAAQNGLGGGTVTAVAGYGGDAAKLEVTVSRSVSLFFMPALGMSSVNISARAVAEHATGGETAIFAKKDTHCWVYGIWVRGSGITINGDAHANGAMTWDGSSNTLTGALTYGERALNNESCQHNVHMNGSNPNVPNPEPTQHEDWPVSFTPSDFPCTWTLTNPDITRNGAWWQGGTMAANRKLNPGVICYNGSGWLSLIANNITGNVTLRAEHIRITGSGLNLTAYRNGVLLYATGPDFPTLQVTITGPSTFTGMIYERDPTPTPYMGMAGATQGGQVEITGTTGFTLNGSIVAWSVKLNGNNWRITGSGVEGAPEPMHLVE
jgi:hypothetical protein